MSNPKAILNEALQLAPRARAQLASDLLASLEEPQDDNVEAAWLAEAERRDATLESGEVKAVGLDEFRKQIWAVLATTRAP